MKTFSFQYNDFVQQAEDYAGICLKCGAAASGVEPDGEGYTCEVCGAGAVAGLEQAFILGRISFTENERTET